MLDENGENDMSWLGVSFEAPIFLSQTKASYFSMFYDFCPKLIPQEESICKNLINYVTDGGDNSQLCQAIYQKL